MHSGVPPYFDGCVPLEICSDGNDEEAGLDTHEGIIELPETTQKDKELQEEVRNWQFSMLVTNTQAPVPPKVTN